MANKLIIDCGATKADWIAGDGTRFRTPGFNLAHTPGEQLKAILNEAAQKLEGVTEIHFYAAGLVENSPVDLQQWFPEAGHIEYASDMLGAARAVLGRESGIAAIVGTGANTCQYDGTRITHQIPCGGFILGDEGAASVLGKLFVADFLKGRVPQAVADAFRAQYPADYPTIVKNVYGSPAPARYLASFAPFILSLYGREEYVKILVDNNFRAFFERTILQYPPLPVGVVGGFGHACRDILTAIGAQYGIRFTSITASPAEGLILYHGL